SVTGQLVPHVTVTERIISNHEVGSQSLITRVRLIDRRDFNKGRIEAGKVRSGGDEIFLVEDNRVRPVAANANALAQTVLEGTVHNGEAGNTIGCMDHMCVGVHTYTQKLAVFYADPLGS